MVGCPYEIMYGADESLSYSSTVNRAARNNDSFGFPRKYVFNIKQILSEIIAAGHIRLMMKKMLPTQSATLSL